MYGRHQSIACRQQETQLLDLVTPVWIWLLRVFDQPLRYVLA